MERDFLPFHFVFLQEEAWCADLIEWYGDYEDPTAKADALLKIGTVGQFRKGSNFWNVIFILSFSRKKLGVRTCSNGIKTTRRKGRQRTTEQNKTNISMNGSLDSILNPQKFVYVRTTSCEMAGWKTIWRHTTLLIVVFLGFRALWMSLISFKEL